MKSPNQFNKELLHLKEAFKMGHISKDEVIKEYKSIIVEISELLGNSHTIVVQLNNQLNQFLKRLDIINDIDKYVCSEKQCVKDLELELGLI
ncbi:hypothetical protein T190115A13A_80208 [Tenacibaculum sp. 190524A02b]|uniref:Uncharacterized protein n=1 Tax=Tenacibaculum vairaonense TaxID=3137860 RepID=A0ABM9PS31_9FLAO